MRAALAFVLLTVTIFLARCAPAQTEPQTEQVETGRASLPNGQEIAYRIRLLPPESFPQLPAAVAAALREKHCMIPQTYEAHEPENVIHGAFEKMGSSDWAALCSVNGTTTLYVFFASQPAAPVALRRQQDAEWLGAEQPGAYGSAWGIATRHTGQTKEAPPGQDGIEDAFVEKSSTVHYFQNGEWMDFHHEDQR